MAARETHDSRFQAGAGAAPLQRSAPVSDAADARQDPSRCVAQREDLARAVVAAAVLVGQLAALIRAARVCTKRESGVEDSDGAESEGRERRGRNDREQRRGGEIALHVPT
jgi:hypothetical protein